MWWCYMKFEIICKEDCEFATELDIAIKNILAEYPHKLNVYGSKIGRRYEISSESQSFIGMKTKVVEKCVSYLLYAEKLKFYTKQINQFLPQLRQFILLRILIFSEFEQEKEVLCDKLINQDIIAISGISQFMLRKNFEEWARTCDVINLSLYELKIDSNYKEFIKGMSSSIKSKYSILYLFCGGHNMLLSDKLEKIHSTFLCCENLSGEEKIVSSLIENYPLNVAIYEESHGKSLNEALCVLFDLRKTSKSIKKGHENS